MGLDSNRIVNLMAADVFYNRKISKRYVKRVEKERFRLQPTRAKKYLKKYAEKYDKPSSPGIEFEQWQIDLAIKILDGKQ